MAGATPGERDWSVITFPASDRVLALRVEEILNEGPRGAPESAVTLICDRLRPVYATIDARVRSDLGGLGAPAVYVFRDGSAATMLDDESWATDPACARVVTDPAGVYLEANDAAGRLFNIDAEGIVGRQVGDFTRPDARIQDAERLRQTLMSVGRLHSLALLMDGRVVEFITVKDGDGPGRTLTTIRELEPG